jgi:hypothetical protein
LRKAPARVGAAAAALRSARVLAGLAEPADAAPGTAAALWAAGGALEALREAVRGACTAAPGAGAGAAGGGGGGGGEGEGEGEGGASGSEGGGDEDVVRCVQWLAAYVE